MTGIAGGNLCDREELQSESNADRETNGIKMSRVLGNNGEMPSCG